MRGLTARVGLFGHGLAGIAGRLREFPATSRGMCAGCRCCLRCNRQRRWNTLELLPKGATCPRRRRVGSSAVSGRGSPPPLGASLSRSQHGGRSVPGPHSERSSPAGISKKMARRALTASSSADRDALPTGRAARVVSRGPSGAVVARARRRASVPTAFQEALRPGLPDLSTRDAVGDLQRSRVTRSSTRAANGMCDVHHEKPVVESEIGAPPHRQEAPAKVI
jgi:hypothetical protein